MTSLSNSRPQGDLHRERTPLSRRDAKRRDFPGGSIEPVGMHLSSSRDLVSLGSPINFRGVTLGCQTSAVRGPMSALTQNALNPSFRQYSSTNPELVARSCYKVWNGSSSEPLLRLLVGSHEPQSRREQRI
jgi:hypothetical protein